MAVQGFVVRRPWVAQVRSVGLLLFGVFLVKTCILDPIATARNHGAVTLHFWLVLGAPGMTLAGLFTTFYAFWRPGSDLPSWLRDPGPGARTWRTTACGVAILLVCLGLGIGAWQWLRSALGELGYE